MTLPRRPTAIGAKVTLDGATFECNPVARRKANGKRAAPITYRTLHHQQRAHERSGWTFTLLDDK